METRSVANRNKRSFAVGGGSESLEQEVSDLLTLATRELREKWSALCGVDPPDRMGRTLLIRAIAYCVQEKAWAASSHPRNGSLTESAMNLEAPICSDHEDQDKCRNRTDPRVARGQASGHGA